MRLEIILGLIAAVFWALYVIILKISSKYLPFKFINLFLSLGVLLAALITFALDKESFNFNKKYLLLPLLAGVMWFLGIFAVNYGIRKNLNLSIMAPIYNINTLLVVILSVILLKEKVDFVRVIVAAILVTIAAILLS